MRRRAILAAAVCAVMALGPAVATADQVDVSVTIPGSTATPTGPRTITDSVLSWAINPESGSGAYFGGCNFLSAGKAGNSGSSRLWGADDGLYRTVDGAVTIEKPTGVDTWKRPTFADRCQDERGATPRTVTTGSTDYGTGNRFVITGGVGTVDTSKGTASIVWKGSVTVVAYGGLNYFWFSDPVLNVSGGRGTLTATAGGYASSREDTTVWAPLRERSVTLATLTAVELAEMGFSVTPSYHEVQVTPGAGDVAQRRDVTNWGAFPQDFITFQNDVGQAAYWYSTGSIRDFAKPPYPVSVSWSAADRIDDETPVDPPRGNPTTAPTSAPTATSSTTPGTAGSTRNSGSTSSTGTSRSTAKPVSKSTSTPAAAAAGVDSYPATTPDALLAGARGLIPAAAAALEDPRAALVTASSALVALATVAFVGFRRRRFILPWSKNPFSGPN